MIGPDAYFEDLLMRVVEGKATEDETATFGGIILMDRELRKVYALEMRVHALLCCKSKGQGAVRLREATSGQAGDEDAAVNSGHRTGRRAAGL